MEVFPKLGIPFWGSHRKDHSILESILGSLYLGLTTIEIYIYIPSTMLGQRWRRATTLSMVP